MSNSHAANFLLLATYIGDLTDNGNVRAMTGNEKGYAMIRSISRGCKVWAHHTTDDRLIIDLMVTKNASHTEPKIATLAKENFDKIANKLGYETKSKEWLHSINRGDIRQQHYIDVSDKNMESLISIVDAIRDKFH